jgi:hypothetical protein
MRAPLLGCALALAAAGPALADCATASTGARCITAPRDGAAPSGTAGRRVTARQRTPRFAPGDVLPRGSYRLLLNSGYYGLPPVEDGWRYYEVEGRVLRVRPDTLEVIGDATAETNRAF